MRATMPTMSTLGSVFRHLLQAVLPVECEGCTASLTDDPVPFFCRRCWSTIHLLPPPACPRCGRPFASPSALTHSPEHLCGDCRTRTPAFTRVWSLYPYQEPLTDAIRLFKYEKKFALAGPLGDLLLAYSMAFEESRQTFECLMPVPLHPIRLKERGFNQSLLLADRLNRRLKLPLSYTNLVRARATPPQTELTRVERIKNLRRAFSVLRPDEVAGMRILLVDDVFTTGTTINECAKVLRKAGAAEVYGVTLARTI